MPRRSGDNASTLNLDRESSPASERWSAKGREGRRKDARAREKRGMRSARRNVGKRRPGRADPFVRLSVRLSRPSVFCKI